MTITAPHTNLSGFTDLYFRLRQKEGRLYTDEEVALLPFLSKSHPLYHEWQVRKWSCGQLVARLRQKQTPQHILEVGCGNGWLARRLAGIPQSRVTGLDIHFAELRQAERVFSNIPNLRFICDTIYSEALEEESFDTIVLAACIQYFPSVSETIQHLSRLLKHDGEIHILDSPFYRLEKVTAARQRTASYYRDMGFPGMTRYYFHHEQTALDGFEYETLHKPSLFKSFFSTHKNPFPWFCLKKPCTPA